MPPANGWAGQIEEGLLRLPGLGQREVGEGEPPCWEGEEEEEETHHA